MMLKKRSLEKKTGVHILHKRWNKEYPHLEMINVIQGFKQNMHQIVDTFITGHLLLAITY